MKELTKLPSLGEGQGVGELHPFTPFLPFGAKLLMLGTFPPAEKRWSMKFYYPNFTNDMWRIVGHCFFEDKNHFVDEGNKTFRLDKLKDFLRDKGIALYDTCTKVVRTKNTASDKDLEVVEETNLKAMLRQLPQCRAVVTAGQLATDIACRQLGIEAVPKMGCSADFQLDGRQLRLYRMPSTSRAYPAPLAQKAEAYQKVFALLSQCTSLFVFLFLKPFILQI